MNEHKKIDNVLTLIKTLDEESRQYLECYMANAPMWILNSFQILELEKETIFIREKSPVDIVYILVEGMVKAVDYCADGVNFEYMWFKPVKLFGTMGTYLLKQARFAREFLFMNGRHRIMTFMIFVHLDLFEGSECPLNITRQQIADCSGLSVKTVNRVIQELSDENYICKRGNKLVITREQYEHMKKEITANWNGFTDWERLL
ncbi:MAG: helix-turn-helix domain-containing protein [Hungatella sp.]